MATSAAAATLFRHDRDALGGITWGLQAGVGSSLLPSSCRPRDTRCRLQWAEAGLFVIWLQTRAGCLSSGDKHGAGRAYAWEVVNVAR